MWSLDTPLRAAALALVLSGATLALSACTLAPVYGDHAERLTLSYAMPESRAEQILYQDLSLRLGTASDPGALQLSAPVTESVRTIFKSDSVDPATPRELTLTARVTVTDPASGTSLLTATRKATATYTTNGQALADESARADAVERAAHALAETIRLTLLAGLPVQGR